MESGNDGGDASLGVKMEPAYRLATAVANSSVECMASKCVSSHNTTGLASCHCYR